MSVLAVIQARMGSSRMPGKVLHALVDGQPILWHVVAAAMSAMRVDAVMVAAPDTVADREIARWCQLLGLAYHLGPEDDVLTRFVETVEQYVLLEPTVFVRLTGDCPLVSPDVIDRAAAAVIAGAWDYVTNAHADSGFCDGDDVEAFSRTVLDRLHAEAVSPGDREHVTTLIRRTGLGFHCGLLHTSGIVTPLPLQEHVSDWSTQRFSVNRPEDLQAVVHRRLPDA